MPMGMSMVKMARQAGLRRPFSTYTTSKKQLSPTTIGAACVPGFRAAVGHSHGRRVYLLHSRVDTTKSVLRAVPDYTSLRITARSALRDVGWGEAHQGPGYAQKIRPA